MIILGWGKRSKKIIDIGLLRCSNCNNIAGFELRELSNRVSLYFVSVAKWKKRIYMVCPVCDAGFELDEGQKNEIINESINLPDNEKSLTIWDYIVNAFNNFEGDYTKIDNFLKEIYNDLVNIGYKKDDIMYVIDFFINDTVKNQKK